MWKNNVSSPPLDIEQYIVSCSNLNCMFYSEAVKDTKGCILGRGKSWMGQAEDSIPQICQLTELKQTKERYPNRFRRLYETLDPARKLAKVVSRMASTKQSQRSSFSFKKTANSKTVYCTLMAQSPKTSQGGASPSSKVRLPSMKKVQSPMPSAGLPHPHRLNELATESGKWNGKSGLECVDGRHPSSKTPVGLLWCTALDMPE